MQKLWEICLKYLCAAHVILEAGGKAETLPEAFGEVPVQGKNKARAISRFFRFKVRKKHVLSCVFFGSRQKQSTCYLAFFSVQGKNKARAILRFFRFKAKTKHVLSCGFFRFKVRTNYWLSRGFKKNAQFTFHKLKLPPSWKLCNYSRLRVLPISQLSNMD
jgi:hypothetical protein